MISGDFVGSNNDSIFGQAGDDTLDGDKGDDNFGGGGEGMDTCVNFSSTVSCNETF